MFGSIESRTYFLFAGLNLLWIPIVWLFYPETSGRSLESIEAMFSSGATYKSMERAYMENVSVLAARGQEVRSKSVEKASHFENGQDRIGV